MENSEPYINHKIRFSRIAASSSWLSAYRIIRMVIAFAVGILVARYLGPEDYGKLHYALAIVMILIGIIGPGMKDVIARHWNAHPENQFAIVRASFRMVLISNITMLFLAALIILILRPGESLILMMAVIIGLGNVFRVFEVYELWFHYKLEMGKTVLIQGTAFLTLALAKIVAVYIGLPVLWFAVLIGTEIVLSGLGFMLLFKWKVKPGFKNQPFNFLKIARPIFYESIPSVASIAFVLILFKVDQIMIGWLLNDTEVGYYAVAVPFSEYWAFLAIAIMTSVYPALLEADKAGKAIFEKYLKRVFGFLSWLSFCIIIPVWLLGEYVILYFLGERFLPSSDILSIHVWSLYFIFMIEVTRKWYVITKRLRLYVYISGIAAILNIGLNYFLIPDYGGIGAAWATIASYSFAGFFGLFLFKDSRKVAVLIIKGLAAPLELPHILKKYRANR